MSRSMRHSKRGYLAAVVVGLGLVVAGLIVRPGEAFAHAPNIYATADCEGVVHFDVISSMEGPDGTNPDIHVYYLINNEGTPVSVTHGAFTAANGNSFSGTFPWPGDAPLITLHAEALGLWGDGTSTVGYWTREWVQPAKNCEATTTTEAATTTTEAVTTTTAAATTTTLVGNEVPTTTAPASTTTLTGNEAPTTTTLVSDSGGNLPSTGSGSTGMALIAVGLIVIGGAITMGVRRPA